MKKKKKIINLLIDYTNKRNIILKINDTNKDGWYPLYRNIYNNDKDNVELLLNYATNNNFILKLNKKKKKKDELSTFKCYLQ